MPKKREKELFLYGRLRPINKAIAYCRLHKCFLDKSNIKEKRCIIKKCKYKIQNLDNKFILGEKSDKI